MSLIQEFKTFAMRGNIIDLATGVIIGAAFGKIVSSLVEHVIMPPIGLLLKGMDFSALVFELKEAADGNPAVVIAYGQFIQNVVDFVIIAACVFFILKAIERAKLKNPPPPPAPTLPTRTEEILMEIRDTLRADKKTS